jgi:hypothetical protein
MTEDGDDTDRGIPKYWEKTCPIASLSSSSLTWTVPEYNRGTHGERNGMKLKSAEVKKAWS